MGNNTIPLSGLREEYEKEIAVPTGLDTIGKPLSILGRLWRIGALRKALILIFLATAWQIYAIRLDNELMLPTFASMLGAFGESIRDGELPSRVLFSLRILLLAYASGILLATALTILAIGTRIGTDLLETLTAMFNPLPAIALLPLAMLWFGLGYPSIVFVLIHSVTWPIALNIYSGFTGVSATLRMVGRNFGLSGWRLIWKILIPAAFPQILTGLKVGWAFAWRTLIASELVFGVSSGSGGLGWFIFERKNMLEIPSVFAGLFTVILIGITVEYGIFQTIESRTIRRWGMRT